MLTDQIYPSHVFAERFNSYFGENARWSFIPTLEGLTDSAAQRDTIVYWALEKDYADKINGAVEQFQAATTLDHKINFYFAKLSEAVTAYKVFIANLEKGSGYDFSKVTWWPYNGAEKIMEKYSAR